MKLDICKPVATFACATALFLFACGSPKKQAAGPSPELLLVKQSVERQLSDRMDMLSRQIAAFATVTAADREFGMKLLVDKDRSAPEVTEIAQRFLAPMALSILSITDSQYVILSCGHFPANTGTVFATARKLGAQPAFIVDNVKGESVLTLQAKTRFTLLDTAVFFACGGIAVEKDLLPSLACWPGYSVFVKQGSTVIGKSNVESISDVRGDSILVNNKAYPAAALALPYAGDGDQPILIVASNKPIQR
jgi:hypothetical protein